MQKDGDFGAEAFVLSFRTLEAGVFPDRGNSRLAQNASGLISYDRSPFDFFAERAFPASFVVRRVFVACLDKNIAIKTGRWLWVFWQPPYIQRPALGTNRDSSLGTSSDGRPGCGGGSESGTTSNFARVFLFMGFVAYRSQVSAYLNQIHASLITFSSIMTFSCAALA